MCVCVCVGVGGRQKRENVRVSDVVLGHKL